MQSPPIIHRNPKTILHFPTVLLHYLALLPSYWLSGDEKAAVTLKILHDAYVIFLLALLYVR
ncbi:hypothetical protein KC734_23760 [candidate division KSB1 bacterium]|nr:hypothetical protein [candidate division KSB1 bacterium]